MRRSPRAGSARSWHDLVAGVDSRARRTVGTAVAQVIRPRHERLGPDVSRDAGDQLVRPARCGIERRLWLHLYLAAVGLTQLDELRAARRARVLGRERTLAHGQLVDAELRL